MKTVAIAFALILQVPSIASGPTRHGAIRICRRLGTSEMMDHRSVSIPAGTAYGSGIDPKTGADRQPTFTVRTTKTVMLPPKPRCVTAAAEMVDAPDSFSLNPHYRWALPSHLGAAEVEDEARVVATFR